MSVPSDDVWYMMSPCFAFLHFPSPTYVLWHPCYPSQSSFSLFYPKTKGHNFTASWLFQYRYLPRHSRHPELPSASSLVHYQLDCHLPYKIGLFVFSRFRRNRVPQTIKSPSHIFARDLDIARGTWNKSNRCRVNATWMEVGVVMIYLGSIDEMTATTAPQHAGNCAGWEADGLRPNK